MIYAASVWAVRARTYDHRGERFDLGCKPVLIGAASVAEAGAYAGEMALEAWPQQEGWHSHGAKILPSTRACRTAIQTMSPADFAHDEDEQSAEVFFFQSSTLIEQSESLVSETQELVN